MRLFADENFPRPAVVALREAGLDLLWIAETHPGAPDDEVLAHCISTRRTLLTFDKDFGEPAFRLTPQTPGEVGRLGTGRDWISALLGGLLQRSHPAQYPYETPSARARLNHQSPNAAIDQNSNKIPTEGSIGNMLMKFRFAAPVVVLNEPGES